MRDFRFQHFKLAQIFLLVPMLLFLFAAHTAFGQSSGPTVNVCTSGVIDDQGWDEIEEMVCAYGDSTQLYTNVTLTNSDADAQYIVGLGAYTLIEGDMGENGFDFEQSYSAQVTSSYAFTPTLGFIYGIRGLASECVDQSGTGDTSNCKYDWNDDFAMMSVSAQITGSMPPQNLVATAGDETVSLSWDVVSGAAGYNVYAGTTSGGESATPIVSGITPNPSYIVSGLTNGTSYYFEVTAVNSTAESGPSNEVSAAPQAVTPSQYVECTPNPVPAGDTTVCSAKLPHTATGTVSFTLDGTAWADATVSSSGEAIPTALPSLTPGPHNVAAIYSGDNFFANVSTQIALTQLSSGTLPTSAVYSFNIAKHDGSTGYDAVGNVVAYTDSANGTWGVNVAGQGSPITYDNLNRLVSATQTLSGGDPQYICWSYDSFGNMKQQYVSQAAFSSSPGQSCQPASNAVTQETDMVYSDATNRISSGGWKNRLGVFKSGSPNYGYTGTMTYDLDNSYLYTPDGQVCAVFQPSVYGVTVPIIGYLYDAEGHRVAKGTQTGFTCDPATNGFQATNVYIIGPDGHEMTEVDGSGNWVHTNISANGSMIATYKNDQLSVHFQLNDWVGTRRVQTDYLGQVEDTCQSQPFGDGLICTGPDIDVSKHHFTGKERDTESGLDYFDARYYASAMGRYMSPDSSGYSGLTSPQSWNLYAYTMNNPLRYDDPTGHLVQNLCGDQDACTAAVAAATGNAKAAARVYSKTKVTHHNFFGIQWDSSVTNIAISGDMASFRALSENARHLADLVESKDNFTVDISSQMYNNDRQGSLGTGAFSQKVDFMGGYTQGPADTGTRNGNVYIKWDPSTEDPEAKREGIPGANQAEAMAHELLGHLWGQAFGEHAPGAANKQDAVNAENVVRATDPSRGQKAQHDHNQ